jgi:hypothetical protein
LASAAKLRSVARTGWLSSAAEGGTMAPPRLISPPQYSGRHSNSAPPSTACWAKDKASAIAESKFFGVNSPKSPP